LPSKKSIILATAGACACLFALGFVDNLKGVTLPAVLLDLHFRYDQGGAVLSANYIGMLIANLLSGALCDLIGPRRVVFIGSGLLVAGVTGYTTAHSYWLLFASMVLLGLMVGALFTAGTNLIVTFHPARKGLFLNLSYIFHSLASMLAPFYTGQMLAAGFSWRMVYQLTLLLAVVVAGLFLAVPANPAPAASRTPARPPASPASGVSRLRGVAALYRGALNRQVIGYCAFDLLYVAAETGLIVWLVEYLQKVRGQSVVLSSTFLSLYFIFIVAGRLAGSLLLDRLGYPRMLAIASAGALACLGLGTFGPSSLAWLLPLSGLFLSAFMPTLAAAVSAASPYNAGSALGIMLAAGGLGGILGAWSAGFVAEAAAGIQFGFGIQTVYALLLFALALTGLKRRPVPAN
jgi:MFS transporter, FHS family, glucose/mannose:H+ symporter